MCRSAELALECRPESVAVGRHFVAEVLSSWGVVDADPAWGVVGDVLLVASELLGNAARACTEQVVLTVEVHRDRVHLDVRDDSPEPAVVRRSEPDALRGRGLAIVAVLSTRWGQSPHDGRTKDVWSDLEVPRGSALAAQCQL